jgi:SAM-dependent methyltransferase
MSKIKVCQGERGTDVTHYFDIDAREAEDYAPGVSVELCPLFDFSREPWMLLQAMTRQVILAHQVMIHTGLAAGPEDITVLDTGAGYGELYALLHRARKAKDAILRYVGVDIDKDKQIIARQLRPGIDYRIGDVLDLSEYKSYEINCVVSGDVLEHFSLADGMKYLSNMTDLLDPGGTVVISFATPLSRLHRQNPFHLHEWTIPDLKLAMGPLGVNCVDAFYIGVPSKDWSVQDARLRRVPRDLARNVINAIDNGAMGNEGIYVGVRV